MRTITTWEVIELQKYYASKKKPTADDKARAKKLEEHLAATVDGLVLMHCGVVQT